MSLGCTLPLTAGLLALNVLVVRASFRSSRRRVQRTLDAAVLLPFGEPGR